MGAEETGASRIMPQELVVRDHAITLLDGMATPAPSPLRRLSKNPRGEASCARSTSRVCSLFEEACPARSSDRGAAHALDLVGAHERLDVGELREPEPAAVRRPRLVNVDGEVRPGRTMPEDVNLRNLGRGRPEREAEAREKVARGPFIA